MRKLFTIAVLLTSLLWRPAWAQEAEPLPPETAADTAPAEILPSAPEATPTTTTYYTPNGEVIADNRIKLLMYNEADVFTIMTRYGYQTNIVFAPQEAIETISVGDRSLWQIIPAGNRIFIRPLEEDATTNMTVLTNRRSYQFDLKSLGPAVSEGNIYVATFLYPEEKKPQAAAEWTINGMPQAPAGTMPVGAPPMPAAAPGMAAGMPSAPMGMPPGAPGEANPAMAGATPMPQPMPPPANAAATNSAPGPLPAEWYVPKPGEQQAPAQAATPSPAPPPGAMAAAQPLMAAPAPAQGVPMYPNYNYTYSGADELAPLQVYDDGKTTYIKYKDWNQPPPSVYVLDAVGKESPVNFNVKDNFMLIDTVAPEMLLKSASGAIRIYNEMLNPR